MGTVNRLIQTEDERVMAARLVEGRKYPFTLTITDGKPRSKAQNRLQHMWMNEISVQKGDLTAEEARAYCKLTIGVPILRSQNEAFRERYDAILKPLSYEQKLSIMSEPLNLPVTSLMSTKQLTEYLEGIIRHFGEQGIILTMPDDMRDQINTNSGEAPLPEPDTADDTSTLADQAADGEGETTASPSAAALSDVQRVSMIECCRKMLAIPAQTDLDQSQKLIVLAEAKDDWKSMTKPAVHENIKGFYESAKAQIKADPRVYPNLRAKAFDLFSEVLDCEAKELGA